MIVSKFVVKFLLKNPKKTLNYIDLKIDFLKIIDDNKLCRKLIFALIGKDNSIGIFMKEIIYEDYLQSNTEDFLEYITLFCDFIKNKLEASYCVLFILINLCMAIKTFYLKKTQSEIILKNDKEFFNYLKKILLISNNIRKKAENSTVNFMIAKTLKTIVYEICLIRLNAKNENLAFKSDMIIVILSNKTKKKKNGLSLEKNLKKEPILFEVQNISFSRFFQKIFNESSNTTALCENMTKETQQIEPLFEIFKVIIKNKKEEIQLFQNHFLKLIFNEYNFVNQEKAIMFLKLIDKFLNNNRELSLSFDFNFCENILVTTLSKYIENINNFLEFKKDLKIIKYIKKLTDHLKNKEKLCQNFLNCAFNNHREEILKNYKILSKILSIFNFDHLEISFFSNSSFSNDMVSQKDNFLLSLKLLFLYFNYLKNSNNLKKLLEQINHHKVLLMNFIKETEINDEETLKLFCNLLIFSKNYLEIKELSPVISEFMNNIFIYFKSLKSKEIEETGIFKEYIYFLIQFSNENNTYEHNFIQKTQEILQYLLFLHSKICEKIVLICLETPRLFYFIEEIVIFL